MSDQLQNQLVAVFVVGALILGAPLTIGIPILFMRKKDALNRYAALLTLKPVLTTPLWYAILVQNSGFPASVVTPLLPGVGLTVLLAVWFRRLFSNPDTLGTARKLLILDCARWLTTGLFINLGFASTLPQTVVVACFCTLSLLALTMPTIFAFVALIMLGKDVSNGLTDWVA